MGKKPRRMAPGRTLAALPARTPFPACSEKQERAPNFAAPRLNDVSSSELAFASFALRRTNPCGRTPFLVRMGMYLK